MTLVFNRDFDPRHGAAVAVAPSVWRVTARNAGPFTYLGTNTYLIGEDDLAIVDPGPDDAAHVEDLLRAIGGRRVTHILVTHSHRDHSDAVARLKEVTGGEILAAAPGVPIRAVPAATDVGGDPRFTPDRAISDGAIVEGRSYRIEVLATPGHASDHLAFALPGRNILFSGDHVMGWSTTMVAPPDGSMREYMASLDRLLERPEQLYLPGHGAEIPDGRAYVRALRTHRRLRERAILDCVSRGDRTIPTIVARIYRDLDGRLRGAASLSVLAHLEDLVARGLIATDGPPTLAGDYRLAAASVSSG